MQKRSSWLVFSCVLLGASLALASANPWPSFVTPARGPARAIGDYSGGCLQGARGLPIEGLGYQVMHPSRKRFFGHPALIDFVRSFGRAVRKQGLFVVLVGDLSQPRGGRAPGGHASHQSGLDADIWYWHPKNARTRSLSAEEREQLSARSILDEETGSVLSEWSEHVAGLLRLAAEDARVDRVFVHPIIKRELCARATDRAFLRKIRPWHGHDDHFHARLACPADSSACTPQEPIAEGDGCDELAFWLDEKASAEREKARRAYQQKVAEGRGWPTACDALLAAQ